MGKAGRLKDMKGCDYCKEAFKIAWQSCRGFQKNSNAGFRQSLNYNTAPLLISLSAESMVRCWEKNKLIIQMHKHSFFIISITDIIFKYTCMFLESVLSFKKDNNCCVDIQQYGQIGTFGNHILCNQTH